MKRILVLLALLVVQTAASGTTLLYQGFDDLVFGADGILIATVKDLRSVEHKGEGIYTYVTFSELELLDGEYAEDSITLRLRGGQVEGRELYVHGMPRFYPSERVVLFARGNGTHIMPFVGWQQGVFRIRKDEVSGAQLVVDHHGNRIHGVVNNTLIKERRVDSDADIVGSPASESAKYDDLPPMDLDRFIGEIKERLEIKREKGLGPTPLVSVSPAHPLPESTISPLKTDDDGLTSADLKGE